MIAVRVAILLVAPLLAGGASAVDITECGQVVPPGAIGQLQRDLDCTAQPTWPFSAEGVRLQHGAQIELNGFAIRGDGTGAGITCFDGETNPNACIVRGPGVVRGFWAGIHGAGCRFVVRGVVVEGNMYGIYGPLGCDLDVDDSNVVDNAQDGIGVREMRARTLIVRGNGSRGIVAGRIDAASLLATQNGREGLLLRGGRSGRLSNSTVIGNDAAGAGYDIGAFGRLRVTGVRCGRSARYRRRRPVVKGTYPPPRVVGSFGCVGD